MHFFRFCLLLLLSTAYAADSVPVLNLDDSTISLEATDGWIIEARGSEICLQRLADVDEHKLRRIHLASHRGNAQSLQEAADEEINRISERTGLKGSSSNDRRSFRGFSPFRTDSGLEGIRADFFHDFRGERYHGITKYYFFDEHGKIFRVCAHVLGNDHVFSEFETLIRTNLKK